MELFHHPTYNWFLGPPCSCRLVGNHELVIGREELMHLKRPWKRWRGMNSVFHGSCNVRILFHVAQTATHPTPQEISWLDLRLPNVLSDFILYRCTNFCHEGFSIPHFQTNWTFSCRFATIFFSIFLLHGFLASHVGFMSGRGFMTPIQGSDGDPSLRLWPSSQSPGPIF